MNILVNQVNRLKTHFSLSSLVPVKKGGNYTKEIHVYLEGDADPIILHDDKLLMHTHTLPGVHEKIEKVCLYRSKLSFALPGDPILFHAFVVLKTKNWYWSIEKNGKCVDIQKSKSLENVINFYRGEKKRKQPIKEVKTATATGNDSILILLEKMSHFNLLKTPYNYLNSNCQHFAKKIFKFAKERNGCAGQLDSTSTHLFENFGGIIFLTSTDDVENYPTGIKTLDKQSFYRDLYSDPRLNEEITAVRFYTHHVELIITKEKKYFVFKQEDDLTHAIYFLLSSETRCAHIDPFDELVQETESKITGRSLFRQLDETDALTFQKQYFLIRVFMYCKLSYKDQPVKSYSEEFQESEKPKIRKETHLHLADVEEHSDPKKLIPSGPAARLDQPSMSNSDVDCASEEPKGRKETCLHSTNVEHHFDPKEMTLTGPAATQDQTAMSYSNVDCSSEESRGRKETHLHFTDVEHHSDPKEMASTGPAATLDHPSMPYSEVVWAAEEPKIGKKTHLQLVNVEHHSDPEEMTLTGPAAILDQPAMSNSNGVCASEEPKCGKETPVHLADVGQHLATSDSIFLPVPHCLSCTSCSIVLACYTILSSCSILAYLQC